MYAVLCFGGCFDNLKFSKPSNKNLCFEACRILIKILKIFELTKIKVSGSFALILHNVDKVQEPDRKPFEKI